MKFFKYYCIILLFLLLTSCSSDEAVKDKQEEIAAKQKFINTIKSSLNGDFSSIPNSSKEFTICIEKHGPDISKKFIVYDLTGDSLLLSDWIVNGEIKWLNDYEFSVTEFPGNIRENEPQLKPKYIYNVLRKTKVK